MVRTIPKLAVVILFAVLVAGVSAEYTSNSRFQFLDGLYYSSPSGTRFGEVAKPPPAYLGASFQDSRDPAIKGAMILEVFPNSVAAKAKFQINDYITAVGDVRVDGTLTMIQEIAKLTPRTAVTLSVIRDGKELKIDVTLGVRPNFHPTLRQENPPRVAGGEFSLVAGTTLGTDVAITQNLILPDGVAVVTGNYEQSWTGLLDVDVGKLAALRVMGNAKLAGILAVRTPSQDLKAGDKFEVIKNAKLIEGEFGKVILPSLPNHLEWNIVYDDVINGIDLNGNGWNEVTLVVKAK